MHFDNTKLGLSFKRDNLGILEHIVNIMFDRLMRLLKIIIYDFFI